MGAPHHAYRGDGWEQQSIEGREQDMDWESLQPLWMGFDYYFDLDAVRVPHATLSLERYQRGVNLGQPE